MSFEGTTATQGRSVRHNALHLGAAIGKTRENPKPISSQLVYHAWFSVIFGSSFSGYHVNNSLAHYYSRSFVQEILA